MQDSYFRLNNIHTLDVLVSRVGAKEDVLELLHQMQLEAHVGHIDFLETCIRESTDTVYSIHIPTHTHMYSTSRYATPFWLKNTLSTLSFPSRRTQVCTC